MVTRIVFFDPGLNDLEIEVWQSRLAAAYGDDAIDVGYYNRAKDVIETVMSEGAAIIITPYADGQGLDLAKWVQDRWEGNDAMPAIIARSDVGMEHTFRNIPSVKRIANSAFAEEVLASVADVSELKRIPTHYHRMMDPKKIQAVDWKAEEYVTNFIQEMDNNQTPLDLENEDVLDALEVIRTNRKEIASAISEEEMAVLIEQHQKAIEERNHFQQLIGDADINWDGPIR